jgi:Tol biopolymer transport system component
VYAVAWSPDGRRIASGSRDNTVQVWDAANGGNVFTYRGHSEPVTAVAWSPDGRRIASAGDDKTVQVWDAFSGNHISAIAVIPMLCGRWPGRPMAGALPRPVMIGRCRCGKPPDPRDVPHSMNESLDDGK